MFGDWGGRNMVNVKPHHACYYQLASTTFTNSGFWSMLPILHLYNAANDAAQLCNE